MKNRDPWHIHKKKLEEHETTIAEAASKKMKLEVSAKNKEMKRLLLQKEEVVENVAENTTKFNSTEKNEELGIVPIFANNIYTI